MRCPLLGANCRTDALKRHRSEKQNRRYQPVYLVRRSRLQPLCIGKITERQIEVVAHVGDAEGAGNT